MYSRAERGLNVYSRPIAHLFFISNFSLHFTYNKDVFFWPYEVPPECRWP